MSVYGDPKRAGGETEMVEDIAGCDAVQKSSQMYAIRFERIIKSECCNMRSEEIARVGRRCDSELVGEFV